MRKTFRVTSRVASRASGFTLVELLTVMTIIAILAALVLGTYKFVQDKGARGRAEAEIKAMETALESYKADNGDYPKNTDSAALKPATSGNPKDYLESGKKLYIALTGDEDGNFTNGISSTTGAKNYFDFKPNQLGTASGKSYPADPWGNAYGYSTVQAETNANGYNPTFDLWSTANGTAKKAGETEDQYRLRWLKNW